MIKSIKNLAYIALGGFLIVIILQLFLSFKTNNFNDFNMRKAYVVIAYCIYLPILVVSSISAFVVFYQYFKRKFKRPLKYFYFILPSIIYFFICLYKIIYLFIMF